MANSFDQIQELLAARRTVVPSDDYLRTLVPELHRRLRADANRTTYAQACWQRFTESTGSFFSPGAQWAAALGVAVLCGVVALHPGASESGQQSANDRILTLSSPSIGSSGFGVTSSNGPLPSAAFGSLTLNGPDNRFTLTQAGDLNSTARFDQQLDRVSLNEAGRSTSALSATEIPANYVLTNHPVSYDTVAAF